jgi:hypothetical protein
MERRAWRFRSSLSYFAGRRVALLGEGLEHTQEAFDRWDRVRVATEPGTPVPTPRSPADWLDWLWVFFCQLGGAEIFVELVDEPDGCRPVTLLQMANHRYGWGAVL